LLRPLSRSAAWLARLAKAFDAGTVAFMAWAISPYVAFGLLVYLLGLFAKIGYIYQISTVVAAIMLAFTAYCYVVAMDGTSSTEALAFVFVPIYLHVGAYAALAVGVVISKLFSRRAAA
jgi:hypothetical protein